MFGFVDIPQFGDAACADQSIHDPEMWFTTDGDLGAAHRARMVCRRCPALRACLEWALVNDERHGIWGATTPLQRDAMRTHLRTQLESPA